jgi:hypothetical protein
MLPKNTLLKSSKRFQPSEISGADGIITGFNADILKTLMNNMNIQSYELKFFKDFNVPIYQLRTGECDLAFDQFTHTESRQNCDNSTCLPIPPKNTSFITGENLYQYACCSIIG